MLRWRQLQSRRQTLHRVRVREPSGTALKISNAACAQPGLFRQRLLRQASRQSVATQQLAQSPWFVCWRRFHTCLARVVARRSGPAMLRAIIARASGYDW